MAKLYFYYAVMNAGKSTHLLQSNYVLETNGNRTLLFTSNVDNRGEVGVISSRLGMEKKVHALSNEESLFDIVKQENEKEPVYAIFLDEVQFMSREHIKQAAEIVDKLKIPVMAYGLKNNSSGDLFGEAVIELLAISDTLHEIRTYCHCGKKANMILRYDSRGKPIYSGPVVEVGSEDKYVSVCRLHYKKGNIGNFNKSKLVND